MSTQGLTQVEFRGDDFEIAEQIAAKLGFEQTAYTSTSALWGLFCLPENREYARPGQATEGGCIIKTEELGFLFVQNGEDLHLGYDFEKVRETVKPRRFAVVHARTRKEAEAYLPDNYEVMSDHDADPEGKFKNCVIEGRDVAGWTLDGYVIPRYGSGMIGCREYPSRHDAEEAACSAMN